MDPEGSTVHLLHLACASAALRQACRHFPAENRVRVSGCLFSKWRRRQRAEEEIRQNNESVFGRRTRAEMEGLCHNNSLFQPTPPTITTTPLVFIPQHSILQ